MIGSLESSQVRGEYCLRKLEEAVAEMEQIDPAARQSERGRRLAKVIDYWDKMVLLAAMSEVNPALTQWVRDELE